MIASIHFKEIEVFSRFTPFIERLSTLTFICRARSNRPRLVR